MTYVKLIIEAGDQNLLTSSKCGVYTCYLKFQVSTLNSQLFFKKKKKKILLSPSHQRNQFKFLYFMCGKHIFRPAKFGKKPSTSIRIFLLKVNFDESIIWLHFFYYILHAYKILRRFKINNYVINQMFNFQVFIVLNFA